MAALKCRRGRLWAAPILDCKDRYFSLTIVPRWHFLILGGVFFVGLAAISERGASVFLSVLNQVILPIIFVLYLTCRYICELFGRRLRWKNSL